MLPSVAGTELAQTLLKDGADSRAVSQAIKAMEKAGVNDTVIRKAAKELTAEEFSRVGRLTKKGLTLELIEKAVDNKAVLEKVSDETLLLFKKSAKSADEIITVLERHGDEAGRLYELYGDEVIDLALKYGDEGLDGVRKHGSDFMVEYHTYGDEFVENYLKYGDEAVDAYVKYGADAADVLKGGSNAKLNELRNSLPDKYQVVDSYGNKIGNVAYSTSDIEGYSIEELKSFSKYGSKGKNGIKNPVDGWVSSVDNPAYSKDVLKINSDNEIDIINGYLRNNDTEYKIIEQYNQILGGEL